MNDFENGMFYSAHLEKFVIQCINLFKNVFIMSTARIR